MIITNDFQVVKDWILISNFNSNRMNDTFSCSLTLCIPQCGMGYLNQYIQIHINQPDRVIRYLKFTLHNHTNESFQMSSQTCALNLKEYWNQVVHLNLRSIINTHDIQL